MPPTLPLVCPGAVRRSTARLPGLGCLVSRWCIEADGTNRTYKLFNIYVGPQQSRALLFCVTAKSSGQHFVFVPPLATRVPWCCLEESSALTQHLYWCHPWPLVCPGSVLRRAARSRSTCVGATPWPHAATRVPWRCLEESSALTQHLYWCQPWPLVCPGSVLRRAARSRSTCVGASPWPHPATRVPWCCPAESSALTHHLC